MSKVLPEGRKLIIYLLLLFGHGAAQEYSWIDEYDSVNAIISRIAAPANHSRVAAADSFAIWLRNLPLKAGNPAVMLYDGRLKGNQNAHHAVVDVDVGHHNLQQCADAIIRLRAEYLYGRQQLSDIAFTYTSGDSIPYLRWVDGERPLVEGNRVRWARKTASQENYQLFRRYLNNVFAYAGTISLKNESRRLKAGETAQPGDFFIQAGSPGHAVLIVDMAVHEKDGDALFLLAQSYMPAQDIHILKNPLDPQLSPWYRVDSGKDLITPEWRFSGKDLRRFRSRP